MDIYCVERVEELEVELKVRSVFVNCDAQFAAGLRNGLYVEPSRLKTNVSVPDSVFTTKISTSQVHCDTS